MAWKSSAARLGPHKNSISEGRGTQLPCLQESRYFPSWRRGARQGSSQGNPRGACPAALPGSAHPCLQCCKASQSSFQSRFVPAQPRKLWQLQTAPSLAVLPVLGWLTQQPSPPEGPPGQAQAVAWPSTGFQLPRLTIFPISSIREAPFIKSSTGAHQHTREKRWNHPQPLNPAASHRLRFGARATARCSPYSHVLPHCAPWN